MYHHAWPLRLPPPNPYLTLLRAQKTIQAVDRQNFILSRQVCDLARENVDLREKIIKMGDAGGKQEKGKSNKTGVLDVGYSKEVSQRKEKELEKQRQKMRQRRHKMEQDNRKGLDRMYSFGHLHKQQPPIKQTKGFRSVQRQHRPYRQHRPIPTTTSYSPTPKKYNYLSHHQQTPAQRTPHTPQNHQTGPHGNRTIIESLSELNKQNPQITFKPILHVQSEPYYQNQYQRNMKGKKTNKVYLEQSRDMGEGYEGRSRKKNGSYSPISKLKSIKKADEKEFEERKNQKQEEVIGSRKTMGKKQYLTLIGDVFEKTKNQMRKTDEAQQSK